MDPIARLEAIGRSIRKDLPCMRCLQAFTRNESTVLSGHFCVYNPSRHCQRCSYHRTAKKDYCDRVMWMRFYGFKMCANGECKVPNLYQGTVSHIMDLVDVLRDAKASGEELEDEEEIMEEIVYWGREVRRAWAKLNLKIRVGKMFWGEVQEVGVERYTEEEVEGFILKAKAKQEGKEWKYGGYGEEDCVEEKSSSRGDERGVDGAGNEVPNELPLKEPSLGVIEAVRKIHQTVSTKSTALLSSQDGVHELLREVVRLQAEMIEGQKELLKSQKEMVEELKRLNINSEKGEAKAFADNAEQRRSDTSGVIQYTRVDRYSPF